MNDKANDQRGGRMINIRITELFGYFNYEFRLMPGGFTILTGPNGFGKSTILKCLEALGNSDLIFFRELEFKEFEVVNTETTGRFLLKKTDKGLETNGILMTDGDIYTRSLGIRVKTKDGIEIQIKNDDYTNVLNRMKQMLGDVYSISEQRLLEKRGRKVRLNSERARYSEGEVEETIIGIPDRLKSRISSARSAYSNISNELDSTFPQRLFQQEQGITEDEFYKKMNLMKEKIEKLNQNGIADVRELQIQKFKPDDARALKVYFEDFDQKYKEYEGLINSLEMFRTCVNNRLLFKKMVITNRDGLRILDEKSERNIPLSKLSSGEKETLVLFYTVLFEIPDHVMLLIDEPEISLHIAWQRMFGQDLKKIAELKNLNALVATHSTQIVSGNRDIQVDLGELYKDGFNKREQNT